MMMYASLISRTCRHTSMPSMPGRLRSSVTRSGRRLAHRLDAVRAAVDGRDLQAEIGERVRDRTADVAVVLDDDDAPRPVGNSLHVDG